MTAPAQPATKEEREMDLWFEITVVVLLAVLVLIKATEPS
jgi:hypothetical protein